MVIVHRVPSLCCDDRISNCGVECVKYTEECLYRKALPSFLNGHSESIELPFILSKIHLMAGGVFTKDCHKFVSRHCGNIPLRKFLSKLLIFAVSIYRVENTKITGILLRRTRGLRDKHNRNGGQNTGLSGDRPLKRRMFVLSKSACKSGLRTFFRQVSAFQLVLELDLRPLFQLE